MLKSLIERGCWLYVFSIFVVFDYIYVGSYRIFEREIDDFTRSDCARPTDQAYKSCIYSNIIKQIDRNLKRATRCSFFSLISGLKMIIRM